VNHRAFAQVAAMVSAGGMVADLNPTLSLASGFGLGASLGWLLLCWIGDDLYRPHPGNGGRRE